MTTVFDLPAGATRVSVAWAVGRLPEPVSVWRSGHSGDTLTFVFRGLQFSVYRQHGERLDVEETLEVLLSLADTFRPSTPASPNPGSETEVSE